MVITLFLLGAPGTEAGEAITFWTTEVEKDRMVVQKGIAEDFARKKGTRVRVVPVQENLLLRNSLPAFTNSRVGS